MRRTALTTSAKNSPAKPFGLAAVVALVGFGLAAPTVMASDKVALGPVMAAEADLNREVEVAYPSLEQLYRHLHSHPELSLEEAQTSASLARELEGTGFQVTRGVGGTRRRRRAARTARGRPSWSAPTWTPCRSRRRPACPTPARSQTRDKNGNEVGVMHACGHDMHMTCWVGTARVLVALKDRWQGTLVFIGQPAEEVGAGAERDARRRPVQASSPGPDYCLALHCDAQQPARPRRLHRGPGHGQRRFGGHHRPRQGRPRRRAAHRPSTRSCWRPASSSTCKRSSAARPTRPTRPVVTVGSIHGGTKHNIIPERGQAAADRPHHQGRDAASTSWRASSASPRRRPQGPGPRSRR